jgi:hypothetical protein
MRYERKYRSEHLDLHEVLQIVRDHPMSFRRLYPDRQVNNVYFDTPELHFLHENLTGVPERRKYRLRWYGSDLDHAAAPVLEVKRKSGEVGDKLLAPVSACTWSVGGAQLQAGFAAVHAQLPPNSPLGAGDLRPVLLNSYLRSYYISYDGKFRLTIDRDQLFRGFNAHQQVQRLAFEDRAIVVEVKYEAEDDGRFALVGQRIPLRLSRNSKYTIGMLLLGNV